MSAAPAIPIGDEAMRDTTSNNEGERAAKLSPQSTGEGSGEHPEGKSSTTKVVVPPSSSEV